MGIIELSSFNWLLSGDVPSTIVTGPTCDSVFVLLLPVANLQLLLLLISSSHCMLCLIASYRTRGLFLSVKGSQDYNFKWIPSFAVEYGKSAQHWMKHNSRTKSVIALYYASMNRSLHKLSIDVWVGYGNFT